ncbi:MAG: stage V sporulation protein S [Bacillota bacterium]
MFLKVSSRTEPKKLAGAIYHALKENDGKVQLQAIGAGAVNQAVKGVAIARGLAAPEGAELKIVPSFTDAEDNGTAINLNVYWR